MLDQRTYDDSKPVPVIRCIEWSIFFSNSHCPFQYTQQCLPNVDSAIYDWDQSSISRSWFQNQNVGALYPSDYTWIPTMYSSQMPYLGYILRTLNYPVVAHDIEVEQVSDGV